MISDARQMSAVHEVRKSACELVSRTYERLQRAARTLLADYVHRECLQPPELVHEAFVRLANYQPSWDSEEDFLNVAVRTMRNILVDRARSRAAIKRGGGAACGRLTDDIAANPMLLEESLAVREALAKLERLAPLQAHLVRLRYFEELTMAEIAKRTGESERSLYREWSVASRWLRVNLTPL